MQRYSDQPATTRPTRQASVKYSHRYLGMERLRSPGSKPRATLNGSLCEVHKIGMWTMKSGEEPVQDRCESEELLVHVGRIHNACTLCKRLLPAHSATAPPQTHHTIATAVHHYEMELFRHRSGFLHHTAVSQASACDRVPTFAHALCRRWHLHGPHALPCRVCRVSRAVSILLCWPPHVPWRHTTVSHKEG